MRRNLHWSVPLALLASLVGLFILHFSSWGAFLILGGLVVAMLVLWQSRKTTAPAITAEKPVTRTVRKPAAPNRPSLRQAAHHPVDRQKLGVLRYTLHQANLDSNAPVFETDDHKIVAVHDILVEMIDIAGAHGRSVDELARDIVAMYPRIFTHAALALRQYPDEELAKAYIARKAMSDLHWEIDETDAN